jgi:3-hydroxybutyryl-CoA dehydratase
MLDNLPRGTICIEDIEMGMTRHLRKVVTDQDIEMFAEVSTDRNPVHLDDEYAQDTIFHGRIAHGMLTAGLISAVIGEQLPGHGTVYMGQTLKFLGPVRPGDMVTAEVEVTGIDHRLPLPRGRQEGAQGRGHGARPLAQARLTGPAHRP